MRFALSICMGRAQRAPGCILLSAKYEIQHRNVSGWQARRGGVHKVNSPAFLSSFLGIASRDVLAAACRGGHCVAGTSCFLRIFRQAVGDAHQLAYAVAFLSHARGWSGADWTTATLPPPYELRSQL